MTLLAGLFAIVAALIGAVIWAGITYATGYQIGFMAIGMGALVGAGVKFGGGEGKVAALFAGGIAIVAMLLGEFMTVHIALGRAIDEMADEALTRAAYEEEFAMADQFVLYTTEENYKEFVFENTYYTEAESAEEVTDAEVQEFLADYAPDLRRLHEERPAYQTWRDRKYQYGRQEIMQGANMIGFVFENLGIVGGIFMVIGLFAAMRVVGEWD